MSSTIFLNQKDGKFGPYYSRKIDDKYLNVTVKDNKEVSVKYGGDSPVIASPKSNEYGDYYIMEVMGKRYFGSEGKSQHGKYFKLKEAPEREEGSRPQGGDTYGSRG